MLDSPTASKGSARLIGDKSAERLEGALADEGEQIFVRHGYCKFCVLWFSF